jgi:hypothetical protein
MRLNESRSSSPAGPRVPAEVARPRPVIGHTLMTDRPIIAHLHGREYCVLADGHVTSPMGSRTMAGRINLDAPDLDFSRIHVRNDALHCDVPGFLVGGPAVARRTVGGISPLHPVLSAPSPAPATRSNMNNTVTREGISGSSPLEALKARKVDLDGRIAAGRPVEGGDRPFMDAITTAYAAKHPGLNVHYKIGIGQAAAHAVEELAKPGTDSVRYVCWEPRSKHHIALDFRKSADGGISMVGIDSLNYQGRGDQRWMEEELKPAVRNAGSMDIKPLMVYTNVQRSHHGCGIFSLGFAKTIWKDPGAAETLHDLARNPDAAPLAHTPIRRMAGKDGVPFLDGKAAFSVLPAAFAKHLQSTKHLKEIRDLHPDLASQTVNGSGETLDTRRQRIESARTLPTADPSDKAATDALTRFVNGLSLDEKRIRMYDAAIRNSSEYKSGMP